MSIRKTLALLTAFVLLLFAPVLLFSANQNNPLVTAIKLFDQQKFQEAEKILVKLIQEKPDHLMINYYYGACRTENEHFGTNEISHLLRGSSGEAPLKTDYYLGIQHHAKKDWEAALRYYHTYKSKTSTKEQTLVNLDEKIKQCNEKYSPYTFILEIESPESALLSADNSSTPSPGNENLEETDLDILPKPLAKVEEKDTMSSTENDEQPKMITSEFHIKKTEAVPIKKREPIRFLIDSEITYLDKSHFKTTKGLQLFETGTEKEEQLKNKNAQVNKWRTQYSQSGLLEEKQNLGEKIISSETELYNLQAEMNNDFALAKQKELDYWSSAKEQERNAFIEELDNYFSQEQANEFDITLPDSLFVFTTINRSSPSRSNSSEEEVNQELIYKIQLGAYRRGLPTYVKRLFDKLSNIRKIENYTDEKGIVVYTTGNLTNYDDAVKMQNQVRREGVEGAYVVPYFNGKRITLKEAKELVDKK